jgi:hypothetical protein
MPYNVVTVETRGGALYKTGGFRRLKSRHDRLYGKAFDDFCRA